MLPDGGFLLSLTDLAAHSSPLQKEHVDGISPYIHELDFRLSQSGRSKKTPQVSQSAGAHRCYIIPILLSRWQHQAPKIQAQWTQKP